MAPTVVVPVFNGFDATARCLESLARYTTPEAAVLLIDDGSTDPRIRHLLQHFVARRANATFVANNANLGFTATANRAFRETQGDVVLLNSDCEVTAGWLEGLARCLASSASIGIACPLSNNATILSLPGVAELLLRDNGEIDVDAIAECVRDGAQRHYPRLPTAVGFCMLVSRRAIDSAGPLDAAYGTGYGEENDFSMRLLDLGLEIACCDDVYVHHEGSVSFGPTHETSREREINAQLLERRWPDYGPRTAAWARANPLRPTVERVTAAAERRRFRGKLRTLHVLHRFETRGGVEEHTRQLVEALKHDVVSTIAYPRIFGGAWADFLVERPGAHLRIAQMNPDLETATLRIIGHPANERDAGVEAAFEQLLHGDYDVVHFHSMLGWNTLALPQLAARSGSAVVFTAHDFSMLCADYNMMEGIEERPCGRAAARGSDEGCVACLRSKSLSMLPRAGPLPIAGYLEDRYGTAVASVEAADAIVCPSEFVATRFRSAFPTLDKGRLRVLAHGVHDLPGIYSPGRGPVLRAAYLGSFTDRKGAAMLVETMRRLAGARVILEAWGPVKERFIAPAREAGILLRGVYEPSALPRLLSGIDVVVLPSVTEESFCLTLSEAQRLGIPVAASAIGAIPERIRDGETGFLFPPGDVDALVRLLIRLRDDREPLARAGARLNETRPKTLEANAAEYLALYREVSARSRRSGKKPQGPAHVMPARAPRRQSALGDAAYDSWLAIEESRSRVAASPSPGFHLVVLEGAAVDADAQTTRSLETQDLRPVAMTSTSEAGHGADAIRHLNRAIADKAGEWIVFIQSGDVLEVDAFSQLARAIEAHPGTVLFYGDDDAMSTRGERYDPAFKPGFSAELLRTHPYVAGFCAVRKRDVVERGGLDACGWSALVSFALRVAGEGRVHAIRPVRAQLVHRLDLNLRGLRLGRDHEAVREAANRHAPRRTMAPSDGRPFNIVVRSSGSADRAAACIAEIDATARHRVNEYLVDLSPAECAKVIRFLEQNGQRPAVLALPPGNRAGLAVALRRATCRWVGVVDARIARFRPGWIETLEDYLQVTGAALVGCALGSPSGETIPGWDVIGAGPWAIAGTPPPITTTSALADLYGAARDVSVVGPRCAFVSRSAALESVVLDDLAPAAQFEMAHLGLALRDAGHAVLAHPAVIADYFGPARIDEPAAASHDCTPPPEVAWMRARWGAQLEDDPFYHPALALGGARLSCAPRFSPSHPGRIRVCAFPFDRWGIGEMRVRQPCAALERAGRAEVLMMEEHDAGRAPNRLEWQRMGADTLFAHNFFHDFQLLALDEYAQSSNALRVIGIDDLLTAIPPQNPYFRTIYRDIAPRIARALSKCDRLVVSTAPLADAFGHHARDVRVIPNAIDETRWAGLANQPRGGDRPRIGWAGARQHLGDLAIIEPVVRATWRDVDWVFFGQCPDSLRPMACEVHEMVPVRDYPSRLASLGLDAAVAPLEDNPFNRAKSNLKLLEYGILGLPVIASDVTPYRGSPAVLVGDSASDWIDAVRAMVSDRENAARSGVKMHAWTVETGSLDRCMLPSWSRALDPTR